jgi:hypothetical protein
VWSSESGDFTPWLAGEENLRLLGETIGIDLELEAQEKGVGPFRADILCRDLFSENWVLIENQLERTDHTHLGQLLTYAAGLNAVTIVWIADTFTDEHRAALDWLNNVTAPDINFFGLEIELWRIGDSAIAPKFNVVCQPNQWRIFVAERTREATGELTESRQLQLEFWTAFSAYLRDRKIPGLILRSPRPRRQMRFSTGTSRLQIRVSCNTRPPRISAGLALVGPEAKNAYRQLLDRKDKVRSIINPDLLPFLSWEELPDRKEAGLYFVQRQMDPWQRDQWPAQHVWLGDAVDNILHGLLPIVREVPTYQGLPDDRVDGEDLPDEDDGVGLQ